MICRVFFLASCFILIWRRFYSMQFLLISLSLAILDDTLKAEIEKELKDIQEDVQKPLGNK